jgi:hypothetical protein
VIEDVTEFFIEESTVEKAIDHDADRPAVGFCGLWLSYQNFGSLVQSYLFFGFLLFVESELQIAAVCGVKMHHKYLFGAEVVEFALLQKIECEFYEFEREGVFYLLWWVFGHEVAEWMDGLL